MACQSRDLCPPATAATELVSGVCPSNIAPPFFLSAWFSFLLLTVFRTKGKKLHTYRRGRKTSLYSTATVSASSVCSPRGARADLATPGEKSPCLGHGFGQFPLRAVRSPGRAIHTEEYFFVLRCSHIQLCLLTQHTAFSFPTYSPSKSKAQRTRDTIAHRQHHAARACRTPEATCTQEWHSACVSPRRPACDSAHHIGRFCSDASATRAHSRVSLTAKLYGTRPKVAGKPLRAGTTQQAPHSSRS